MHYRLLPGMLGLVAFTTLAGAGCFNVAEDCYLFVDCRGNVGGGGSGGGGGSTTTLDPGCVPSNVSEPVGDDCGVFVSRTKGNDSNPGSKDKPFATIAKAVGAAKGQPVYLCGETFTEAVELSAGALIYGGLDCTAEWSYSLGKRSVIAPAAGEVALHVRSQASVELYDVDVTAADATTAGGSSIALLAEGETEVRLSRGDVTAGRGADGTDGDAPMGTGTAGIDGAPGNGNCDSDVGEFGGSGGQLTCDALNVAGGDGGNGTKNMTGGAGSPGQPEGMGAGLPGSGQKDSPATDCTDGGAGMPGTSGAAGQGAPASIGTLSPTGYQGVAGNDGQPGQPGKGGGGGGGGKACANAKAGPSGGGGGSGGCGGLGGKGGQPAGSSIAVLSLGSKLTFDNVKITAKNGGKGGAGGTGQPGGPGGAGGPPGMGDGTGAACSGGPGGDGGPGGLGGGGLGGHSIGIVHTGDAPATTGATITTGTAGNGGLGDGAAGTGAAGIAQEVHAF